MAPRIITKSKKYLGNLPNRSDDETSGGEDELKGFIVDGKNAVINYQQIKDVEWGRVSWAGRRGKVSWGAKCTYKQTQK